MGILFEIRMAELAATMGKAKVSLNDMEKAILELSERTGKTSEEIAEYARMKIAEGWQAEGVYKLIQDVKKEDKKCM